MIALFKNAYDNFFGAGAAAVTVPPMDGALLPNDGLDQANAVCQKPAPDNLVIANGQVLFSSGSDLWALNPHGEPKKIEGFGANILALASNGQEGLAIAITGRGILIRGAGFNNETVPLKIANGDCITAMNFEANGDLLIAVGSSQHTATLWANDLLSDGRHGLVLRAKPSGQTAIIADRLAWPSGLAVRPDGTIIVSEAWRHRLVVLKANGRPMPMVSNLPAYPGKITLDGDKAWLSLFAPRRQMIEFILREKAFRKAMMAQIEPDLWMAPALRSGSSFREPLQGGAVKQLGVLKAWAPTRSYGLLVRFDENFLPELSFHSRADGQRHGITSSLRYQNRVFATSKGGDVVLALSSEIAGEPAL